MEECDYCGASMGEKGAYLDHLADAHEDELGAIDRRRVEARGSGDGGGLPTGPAVLAGLLLVAIALTGSVLFVGDSGGGGASGPVTVNGIQVANTPDAGTVHEHGTMVMRVEGDRVDFSQSKYQVADRDFHFERGNGRNWHKHAPGVTLEYAMATLGIAVNRTSVTYRGRTYVDGKNATVSITVDGQPVDPATYVLQGAPKVGGGGDRVRIVAEST